MRATTRSTTQIEALLARQLVQSLQQARRVQSSRSRRPAVRRVLHTRLLRPTSLLRRPLQVPLQVRSLRLPRKQQCAQEPAQLPRPRPRWPLLRACDRTRTKSEEALPNFSLFLFSLLCVEVSQCSSQCFVHVLLSCAHLSFLRELYPTPRVRQPFSTAKHRTPVVLGCGLYLHRRCQRVVCTLLHPHLGYIS